MTANQAREFRRARKRRFLRLLSDDSIGMRGRATADDLQRQEIRRAMREWGAVTLPFAWYELTERE